MNDDNKDKLRFPMDKINTPCIEKAQQIGVLDLLWEYDWLAGMMPILSFQVNKLIATQTNYGLVKFYDYLLETTSLLPQIIDSCATDEDINRIKNLIHNCFTLKIFNRPNTLLLLRIIAAQFGHHLYTLCDRISRRTPSSKKERQEYSSWLNYLEQEKLIERVISDDRIYQLTELGKELVELWHS